VPIGVHLANRSRGNLALEVLASAGLLVGGIAVASATPRGTNTFGTGEFILLVGVPVAQIAASIAIEHASPGGK
jgi:hypothetical protein